MRPRKMTSAEAAFPILALLLPLRRHRILRRRAARMRFLRRMMTQAPLLFSLPCHQIPQTPRKNQVSKQPS